MGASKVSQLALPQADCEAVYADSRYGNSLQNLSRQLQGMSRTAGQYVVLYRTFQDLEGQYNTAERTSNQAFQRFTSLQTQYTDQADEIRVARENWADEAYAQVDSAIAAQLATARREEAYDTTGADGVARVRVPAGRWWVYARYELPYSELYWNVPIEVPRGEQIQLQLTRENAQVRPKL
jgi:hypothetical protein